MIEVVFLCNQSTSNARVPLQSTGAEMIQSMMTQPPPEPTSPHLPTHTPSSADHWRARCSVAMSFLVTFEVCSTLELCY